MAVFIRESWLRRMSHPTATPMWRSPVYYYSYPTVSYSTTTLLPISNSNRNGVLNFRLSLDTAPPAGQPGRGSSRQERGVAAAPFTAFRPADVPE